MKTLVDYIKIVSLDDMSKTELEQIDRRVKTLLLSIEETIPGSRAFGLTGDYLDLPVTEAASVLAAELQEKADIYIPEIKIAGVSYGYSTSGRLEATIEIERRR